MRFWSIVGWGLVVLAWLVSIFFAFGVIWYQGPDPAALRIALIVAWAVLSAVCAIWFQRTRDGRPWLVYLVPFAALTLWFLSIAPRNDRDWFGGDGATPDLRASGR